MHEALSVQSVNPVPADVQVHEAEPALHVVVVAQILDGVPVQVEPEQGLGDEGVIEPAERVVGHVQPLEVVLSRQQTVYVVQTVVVQSKSLKEQRHMSIPVYTPACMFKMLKLLVLETGGRSNKILSEL